MTVTQKLTSRILCLHITHHLARINFHRAVLLPPSGPAHQSAAGDLELEGGWLQNVASGWDLQNKCRLANRMGVAHGAEKAELTEQDRLFIIIIYERTLVVFFRLKYRSLSH